jgi:hypothetical protein
MIGVNKYIANMDAEGIEHQCTSRDIKKIRGICRDYKEKGSKNLIIHLAAMQYSNLYMSSFLITPEFNWNAIFSQNLVSI